MSKVASTSYSQSDVEKAVDAVRLGMSLRTASKTFGVPKSTVYSKVKNIHSMNATLGPASILTPDEEDLLVKWIFHSSDKGFPVTKDQLLDSVKILILELKRDNPFTNNRPGRHWYEGFCRRHPELFERVAQNLTYNRASVIEQKLKNWFNEFSEYLTATNLLNIDPKRIFNCDETAFMLCPKADRVIVRRGAKGVYKVVDADEKECLTTLFMVNAAGTMVPPMVMYWYQRIPASVSQNVPSGWSIGTSDRGWMTKRSKERNRYRKELRQSRASLHSRYIRVADVPSIEAGKKTGRVAEERTKAEKKTGGTRRKKIQQEKRKQLQEENKRILAQKQLQIDAIKRELAENRQCQKKTGAKQKKQRVTEQ
ncbi:uncharacterized protein LOC112590140 isoform X1 [Harpegnathos saltator]|uniref:uncharacterized protein LOC112590140 isoform X1 n=1 Tax=Harpegnathos saltator TaxID=610380 RepID=UPI000DBED5BC|nr:uncharacterized protein LOC112590140 isoform X1 [Harpegnathos saltator]XP_025161699.1 uncharacterized protein LOC112590140 isoform X1 [Harpegnathos saltator]XP_025161700.1 uncharacterized protein LOC112590140 isoform X1 [Harpegnathos saltator]XP_025161701.1 uncharacterized protein LOC112590140 isoform X1 [Harpegnathos saltator]XP_025161702.1 uncharacterized protein LOC112590140 isoform X1 [Harpegnathos saltator]XP_025161703.1 uncharacterized protein LOC112590140 isoform X1 [Harpegnathos sal